MSNAAHKIDFYKSGHKVQYPENTTLIYSNLTPRTSRIPGIDHVVFFGMQAVILKFLIYDWRKGFFNRDKESVLHSYKRRLDNALGKDVVDISHIAALYDLGYLPLEIKALPEGTLVPIKVPVFTIKNTKPEFFWLVNYLESAISNLIWKPITSATLAFNFRKNFEDFYAQTIGENIPDGPVMFQGHDFSYRGMSGDWDAEASGAGHLLSFWGTDTVPAIDFLEDYYFADSDKEMIGCSVPATEHSVMCMGGKEDEITTFRKLITETYPSGIVSIVSDTWDFWKVVTEYLPILKDEITNRKGKVVIRPDSGDPYRIICGYMPEELVERDGKLYFTEEVWNEEHTESRYKTDSKSLEIWQVRGLIQCLWDTFGGSMSTLGYRILSEKIGAIYGDSINLTNQVQILQGLKRKGFASTNIVLGIGSYTYEYQTRDTFGFAMKATYGEVEEAEAREDMGSGYTVKTVGREIFKDPKTDSGMKKSARGLLQVFEDENNELHLKDQCTWEEEQQGLLQTVFLDGQLIAPISLSEIRNRVNSYII